MWSAQCGDDDTSDTSDSDRLKGFNPTRDEEPDVMMCCGDPYSSYYFGILRRYCIKRGAGITLHCP